MNKLITSSCVGLIAGATLMLGGCSSGPKPITSAMLRKNPSPELYSYAATKEQFMNDRAGVANINSRQIQDDLNTLLLLDQPMHTNQYAVP